MLEKSYDTCQSKKCVDDLPEKPDIDAAVHLAAYPQPRQNARNRDCPQLQNRRGHKAVAGTEKVIMMFPTRKYHWVSAIYSSFVFDAEMK